MYQYAIFDLDGTLANTLEDLADAVNYALVKNGFKPHPNKSYRLMVGSGIINLVKTASGCDKEETISALKADFDKYYGEHAIDKTCAYPQSEQVLLNLQNKGVVLAVLSNKPDTFVKAILDKLFPNVQFKEAWGQKQEYPIKPDPASLNALLKKLNADKASTVYIGDSNVDVFTARNGEVDCIGCSWGFRGKDELLNAGVAKIADTYTELEALIIGE